MKGIGIALLIFGAVLMGWAMVMNVAVDAPGTVPEGFPAQVANNDLMNQRLLLAIIGAGSFVSGWLTLILDRLPKRAKAVANNAEGQY